MSGRKRHRKFCPHCEEYLSKSAFYEHKKKYYDSIETKAWKKHGGICQESSNKHFASDAAHRIQLSSSDTDSSSDPDLKAFILELNGHPTPREDVNMTIETVSESNSVK